MSAFSRNRRRILSLWLPRLPTDRIKRQLSRDNAAPADALSGEAGTGWREINPSKQNPGDHSSDDHPSIVVAKQNNALQISALDDAAAASRP